MASGLTFVWLTMRLAAPAKMISASTPANNAILTARLIPKFSLGQSRFDCWSGHRVASDKLSEPVCQLTTGYFGLRACFMKRFTVANNLGEPSASQRDGPDGPVVRQSPAELRDTEVGR